MVTRIFNLLLGLTVAGILVYADLARSKSGVHDSAQPSRTRYSATQTWGNPASLPDHFARHGADFGARDANEYAWMASQFLQHARAEGLPAKVDSGGVLRIFDPRSGTFGAYNSDGTTKTFFKPGNRGYFDHQPGQLVNLQTGRQR